MGKGFHWHLHIVIIIAVLVVAASLLSGQISLAGMLAVQGDRCPDPDCKRSFSGWGISEDHSLAGVESALEDATQMCRDLLKSNKDVCELEITDAECPELDCEGVVKPVGITCEEKFPKFSYDSCNSGSCYSIGPTDIAIFDVVGGQLQLKNVFKANSKKTFSGCSVSGSVTVTKVCTEHKKTSVYTNEIELSSS